MKKSLLLFIIIIFPWILIYAQAPDPNLWDFGKVKEGVVLKHDFLLKNSSDKIMNIKEVHTSCGCTTSEVKNRRILPGEETEIEVKFNTKGYSGPVRQFVYVHTVTEGDNNLEIKQFIVKADVVKQVKSHKA